MEASRRESFVVEASLPGVRLDTFLRTHFPAVSRGTFQRLIEEGNVLVNQHAVKSTYSPVSQDLIEVRFPEPKTAVALPEQLPLDILHEDDDLIVLNKAPGVVVHPSAGHEEHTLVNALLHHCAGRLSGIGGVARPGIVHRLDKDTSGCLVVAKNDATHQALALQFQNRDVHKAYRAILCGVLQSASGEIRASIARHPSHRKKMAVTDAEGRDARTTYKVLGWLNGATYVEALLHTGRTHQIRVHFQFLRHPLVGDEVYGDRQNKTLTAATGYHPLRQMLHAHELSFLHPSTGKTLKLIAPIPADFQEALTALAPAPAQPSRKR